MTFAMNSFLNYCLNEILSDSQATVFSSFPSKNQGKKIFSDLIVWHLKHILMISQNHKK